MDKLINGFIALNCSGKILELCETYYADELVMLNEGEVFASSIREAYEKQAGYVDAVEEFDIRLVSKEIVGDVSTLVFDYKMTTKDGKNMAFTGKHVQAWRGKKIIREEYFSLS